MLEELPVAAKVLSGSSFEEGVDHLQRQEVHLAIIDINLTGRSGLDLLKWIRENSLRPGRIIVMSNTPTPVYRQMAYGLGCDHFLDKFSEFEKIPEYVMAIARSSF